MAKAKSAAKNGKKVKSRARKIWGRIGLGALVAFIIVGLTGLGGFFYLYSTTELPDPNEDFTTNTTFIYYNDGQSKMSSLSVQNRVSLDYEEMPQTMKDAAVAAENRSFWEDPGFSVSGMARAAWNIATGGEIQGGSTITQQYIKILYLDSGQTLSRKVKELFLSMKMGRELSKEEILEGYLNTIYFGRGAYGIESASRSFFLKNASELTLSESAALAAILNNPSAFNPSGGDDHLAALYERYKYVLDGMLEMGTITQSEHDKAYKELPEFPEVPVNNRYGGSNGFLVKQVEEELVEKGFTEEEIQGGGLHVTTTIDKDLQKAAAKTAKAYTKEAAENAYGDPDPDDLHVAISSVDTATGGILAQYGGPDYVKDSRNWATTPRPAASTFKAFATIAGLRNGFSLDSIFNGNTFTPRGDTKTIRNEFSYQYGPVTLRKATADSINTAFVDMTQQIENGASEVEKAANDAGAPTTRGWDLNSRIALGAAEVSPLNMANSYATLANSGKRNDAHIVAQVTDGDGKVLYEAETNTKQTIDKNVAANVTDALTSVVTEGTGTKASALGRPVAGKTGTNGVDDDITSAWFVGYTKQISTAVMYVAGDSGNEDLDDYKRPWDSTFFGSSYPLMTWVDFMTTATEGMEVKDFDVPGDIEQEAESEVESTWQPTTQATEEETEEPEPSTEPSAEETQTESPDPEPTTEAPVTEEPEPEPTTEAPVTEEPEPEPEPTTEPPVMQEPEPDPEPTVEPTTEPGEGTGNGGNGQGSDNAGTGQGKGDS